MYRLNNAAQVAAEAQTQVKIISRDSSKKLIFKKITLADIPEINRILQMSTSRTCDYTIGGLYMWIDYFKYTYCIISDTLFIKGVSEIHPKEVAFSLPIGKMPIGEAIDLLREYCQQQNIALRFSAIPEDRLADFRSVGLTDTEQLTDWSDYLYEAQALASLSGKKLSKKRNHVNRFIADNPGYELVPLTLRDVHKLKALLEEWSEMSTDDSDASATAGEEHRQVCETLDNLICYPFEGAMLKDGTGRIVAFTLGEIIGDTLFVHIEKMRHDVAGAGETINKLFACRMLEKHPEIVYINREEDTGDAGLRKAKESYHPTSLLRKYDIVV